MKFVLLILVIAVGGYAAYLKTESSSALAAFEAQQEELRTELAAANLKTKEAEKEIKSLTSKIAKLSKGLTEAGGSVVETTGDPADAPVPVTVPNVPAGPDKVAIEKRMSELRVIYDRNYTDLTAQKAKLTENLSKANAIKQQLHSNAPKFDELRTRRNSDLSTSNVGVKMSQSDRNEILEKHQAQVDQITTQIAAIEGEMVAVDGRFQALDRSYNEAVEKAMEGN